MSKRAIIFVAAAFIVRLLLAILFPLTADESYYWLWSKHLALSYVDHPPMVAYINFSFTWGKEFLFGIRLGAALIFSLTGILLYLATKELFDENKAFWSLILFNLIPHFAIIWLTQFVEIPLGLFWILSIYLLIRVTKQEKPIHWYLLGLSVGLGTLSKYTMFLFWPCLALFILLCPEYRKWLKQKELYICTGISILLFLPVVYWNAHLKWASFAYHSGKVSADAFGAAFLAFLADQLVHFNPAILFLLFPAYALALKGKAGPRLFFSFSAPILGIMLLLSFKVKIWAHWPAIGYFTAIPLIISYLADNKRSYFKFFSWIIAFSLLILSILFWITPAILFHQDAYSLNYQLKTGLSQNQKIYTKNNVSASLLEFYLQKPVYLATGFFKEGSPWGEKQYEIWGIPDLKRGENIIYFGEASPNIINKAKTAFASYEVMPELKLNLIEDYITHNFKFIKLINYRANKGHP